MKRPVDKTSPSSSTSEEAVRSRTGITIPLKKEDIVEKKAYVKEEIIIKKNLPLTKFEQSKKNTLIHLIEKVNRVYVY